MVKLKLCLTILLLLSGCSMATNQTQFYGQNPKPALIPINLHDSEPITKTNSVYTTSRTIALTFNGLPPSKKVSEILSLLKTYNMKATFFVPGIRAAEEPNLVIDIVNEGHEIANNTLSKTSLTSSSDTTIYQEVALGKDILEKITNVSVDYLRAETSQYELSILKSASKSNHKRYIGYSLYLTDNQLSDQFITVKDLRKYIQRGAIIAIDLDKNNELKKMMALIYEATEEVKYELVTVSELIAHELPKKPYYEIEGFDLVGRNDVLPTQTYHMFTTGNNQKKHVVLTFDDWGTDFTVTTILDILAEKKVIASFYLRANGTVANPSLARAILDEGHEVANHTFSHQVITTLTTEQLQDEIINAHYAITEALQQVPAMFFRPPTGAINDNTAKVVAATGYYDIAMYDVTTYDWNTSVTADEIYQIIVEETVNGSIILLHMLDDLNTIEALPRVIDTLKEQGFTFVTTAEILK